ncbi:MAG: DegT/DnrJ/EryC1/StrS family aminotransferase [Alphaproteobacteria bacterium]|nr:MAG: DegT/DnrJ/EryC1/StrS family aminotransferase [Alphaproteobacteria bacterium]
MSQARVAFFDLGAANKDILPELEAAALRVVRSGWFVGGPEVSTFEKNFARYVGSTHGVGVGNGMDALSMALMALGVGEGDEVIVPGHTFIATWLAVSKLGAVPVPVSIDEDTYAMDADAIEAAITPKTKVIMPVHLYGHPAPMPQIMDIAKRYSLKVVDDAAQAQGAEIGGRRIGSWGDATCWSFYPAKNLGALGDAGGVTTSDDALAASVRKRGNYGSETKYVHDDMNCMNSRLDPMQAAFLDVKLGHLDAWNQKRCEAADFYNEALKGLPLHLPKVKGNAVAVWHMYVIRTERREELQAFLQEKGIPTLIHYPHAITDQRAYATMKDVLEATPAMQQARRISAECLSLPFGPHHTREELQMVVDALHAFFAK